MVHALNICVPSHRDSWSYLPAEAFELRHGSIQPSRNRTDILFVNHLDAHAFRSYNLGRVRPLHEPPVDGSLFPIAPDNLWHLSYRLKAKTVLLPTSISNVFIR